MSDNSDSTRHALLERAYALKNPTEAQRLYDEWASTYDNDMTDLDYHSPKRVADAAHEYANLQGNLLDAGCGTGLVGVALAELGAKSVVDGIDISPGMLDLARKTNAYRRLWAADLTKPLSVADGTYEAVLCSGTLTHGHVGPEAIDEFARLTTKNGVIIATVIDAIWESGGFRSKVEELVEDGMVEVLSTEKKTYWKSADNYIRLVVLRRLTSK